MINQTGVGNLRHRVTLQVETATPDVGPGTRITWATLATVWAKVTPLSSGEQVQAQSLGSAVTYTFRIRYRTDVTAANRVVWESKTLQIASVVLVDGRKAYLDMLCGEIT